LQTRRLLAFIVIIRFQLYAQYSIPLLRRLETLPYETGRLQQKVKKSKMGMVNGWITTSGLGKDKKKKKKKKKKK
jgi:hypothetical protein